MNKKLMKGIMVLVMVMGLVVPALSVIAAPLSDDETYWLTYMREEEKLARDVYLVLRATWGSQIFDNISVSEQTHMNAIKTLLVRYGVADPVTDDTVGLFTDKFQGLYDKLIKDGSASLIDALKVGVWIEETDIDDLTEAINSTTHKDIKKVYTNLINGSSNHLAAFCSNLGNLGVPCQ